ncbi:hypothetical protein M011DRAFT_461269 [Sporormia fimetaria CBS 119925]|uniref:Uncharacterized protein n=1 Tax=Sporormia fimetaria CBS 119925 TaxID=1340428 RepID=A0A6A6V4B4_9PLEO|nr:hypothetical protein M011DRAFT_461269 [Sporormia fimetaria CBS 119925]
MPSTTLNPLYGDDSSEYRDLSTSDIKHLVSLITSYPHNPADLPAYFHSLKKQVKHLPSHLRTSTLSKLTEKVSQSNTNLLCSNHTSLHPTPILSLWSTIHHELSTAIGPFLYPLLTKAGLTSSQERRLRVVEPASQMWDPCFNIHDSTPPNRSPMSSTDWGYQADQCPACILSRIATDADVCFAILACMVARWSARAVGELGNVKSKRVLFVFYLVKAHGGNKMAEEAWDLGVELKRVKKTWKAGKKESKTRGGGFYGRGRGERVEDYGGYRDAEEESEYEEYHDGPIYSPKATLFPPMRTPARPHSSHNTDSRNTIPAHIKVPVHNVVRHTAQPQGHDRSSSIRSQHGSIRTSAIPPPLNVSNGGRRPVPQPAYVETEDEDGSVYDGKGGAPGSVYVGGIPGNGAGNRDSRVTNWSDLY